MSFFPNDVVLVTGTPGARTYLVVDALQRKGYSILWPGQELLSEDAKRFFEYNKQNIEVHNIHRGILQMHDIQDLFTDNYPSVDDAELLINPKGFLLSFQPPARVVISDNLLAPFLSLWTPFATSIVDITANEAQDMRTLASWVAANTEKLAKIRQEFISKRNQALAVWPHKVISVLDEQLEKLFGVNKCNQ